MKSYIYLFIILVSTINLITLASTENFCGNWESIKDQKCIKIINEEKLMTNEDAVENCTVSENGATLLTIHSKEEQEFVEKYLFDKRKIVENVWLGLKNYNNKYEWVDGTPPEYTNWANGSPGYNKDRNCFALSSDSSPIGKWVDIQCNRKLIAVCEKPPTASNYYLQKNLFETKDMLLETQNQLKNTIKELLETRTLANASSQQLKETQKQLSNNEIQLHKTINELNETKKQLNANSEQLKENDKQWLKLKYDLISTQTQLNTAINELNETKKLSNSYSEEMNETQKQLNKLKNELKENSNTSDTNSEKLSEIKKQLNKFETKLHDTINELNESRKLSNSNSELLKENEKQLITTQHELSESHRLLENTFQELTETKRQLNSYFEQIKESQKQWSKTKFELTETQTQLNNTLEELNETSEQSVANSDKLLKTEKTVNRLKTELTETQKQLTDTTLKFTSYSRLLSNHFYSFTDSDGNQRAFIFPVNENNKPVVLDEAYHICNKYNASLVDINTQQKQNRLEAFLRQLDSNSFPFFWLDGRQTSPGKWKWLRSGNDFTYTNWDATYPVGDLNFDYIWVYAEKTSFGKWGNNAKTDTNFVICELDASLHMY